jgi:hypothetical protein
MFVAEQDVIGVFWLRKFKDWVKKGIRMRHPTRAEAKRIRDDSDFVVYMQFTVLVLSQRFKGCGFEAKDGATEYSWHLVRKKMGELCSPKNIYTLLKALTPELIVNEMIRIEWDIFKTTEWIMDEIN